MHKLKKFSIPTQMLCGIFCFFLLISFSETNIFKADVSGLCPSHQTGSTCPGHGHSWETPSTCGTCNGTCSVTVTCSTCKGKGYTPNALLGTTKSTKKTGIKACSCGWKGTTSQTHYCLRFTGCSKCGGSGYIYYYASSQFTTSNFTSAATKGDTAYSGYTRGSGSTTASCSNCYNSGTYKGKNTRCTRSNCDKHAYAPWSEYLDGTGICYTDSCTPIYGNHESNHTYQYDSSYHWTNCIYCGGSMTTNAHSYGNEWTSNGYRYQSCTCGYSKNNGVITYYIAYHGNGATGGSTSTSTHTYHSSSYLNANGFYRTGYSFAGWSTDSSSTSASYYNGQAVSNLTQTHGATINLYALWTPNNYRISFHANGGTDAALISLTTTYHTSNYYSYGGIIPSRIGYTFLGWYTAIDGGSQVYDARGVCVNETGYWSQNFWVYPNDLTLYAHWHRNEYTVSYQGNGGTVSTSSKANYYNEAVDLTSVTATKAGFVFTGWSTSPNAKTPLQSYTMPNANLTLYAIYSIPVSDISGVYLVAWPYGNPSAFRTVSLSKTAAQELNYTYSISNANLSNITGATSNSYALVAYDNAGNHSILLQSDPPPPLDYYIQTVHHYFYHPIQKDWVWFDTSSALKLAGETFTPAYLDSPPAGYIHDSIDNAYIVTGDQISRAYYKPATYVITFDPTGGTVTPSTKNISYQDLYGELPTPQREGYQFIGWYTKKDGGTKITGNCKYDIAGDTTLYAHWQINRHTILYDYWTNGGDSASLEHTTKNYGDSVDLSVTATKLGWNFIGWNTNPDATTPLASITLGDSDLHLYAIYKKDITANFVDSIDKNTRTTTLSIYNRQTQCNMPIPILTELSGWTSLGWSLDSSSNATIHAAPSTEYLLSENATFYGCYSQEISVFYDTNGSVETIPTETKSRFFNASGTYKNPIFTLAGAPHLPQHSFVHWVCLDSYGNPVAYYAANENVSFEETAFLLAKWDQYPVIEAYNRYFTLSDAITGEITIDKLFEKVIVRDKEDGTLINGIDVLIPNFNSYDFFNNDNVMITYQAQDSFGNMIEKTVTVYIVDTTVNLSPIVYYPRFISTAFFGDDTHLISEDLGGLKITSIWRTSEPYNTLLKTTLETETPIESFTFTKEELLLLQQ
ncbi:MAG: InlB B-repeat-containing protein [Agathobacter sp.]|nr:InlB B-repeat-containing protein [Agathobacter sp.]